jgi:hypothetical protein
MDRVRCKKLTASIVEFADLGRVHDSGLAIGPIESPLMRLRIVPTQRQALDVAGCPSRSGCEAAFDGSAFCCATP